MPEEFLECMRKMLGDEFPAFLRAMEQPPALALQLNPRRSGSQAAATAFANDPVPWEPLGRYLIQREELRPGSSIAHASGAFYLQEASAMASGAVLDAQPGERVLDLCAAPGGKSTQIAAAMDGSGLLLSNDPELSRARTLAGNLERMGAVNAIVVSALPQALAERWPEYFDAVLVDAPCSGEGMFRRDPGARSEWNPSAPAGCAKRQAEILDQAARLLRPGGRLVYSTCTFNETENEGSIRSFLKRHPDFAPEDFALEGVGTSREGMLRLFPHRVRGDGHFVARLRKSGTGRPVAREYTPAISREAIAALDALTQEVCSLPDSLRSMRLIVRGELLFCQPQECPPLDRLRVVSSGLCLAKIGRRHVEPAHALAMSLPLECARLRVELDEARALAWLRGEALPMDGQRGWTLVLYNGLPLGWGKLSDEILKNHLPRGLRRN